MTDKPFIERTENARALDLTNIPDDLSWLFDNETNDHFDLFAAHGMCGDCWKQQHECECGDELRLQELLEDFEAAAKLMFSDWLNRGIKPQTSKVVDGIFTTVTVQDHDVDWFAHHFSHYNQRLSMSIGDPLGIEEKAQRYIIARDFNVWEDGKWQMTWKLTYGGSL